MINIATWKIARVRIVYKSLTTLCKWHAVIVEMLKLTDVWWKEFLFGEDCRAEAVVGDSISEELGLQGTCKHKIQSAFLSLLNKDKQSLHAHQNKKTDSGIIYSV